MMKVRMRELTILSGKNLHSIREEDDVETEGQVNLVDRLELYQNDSHGHKL
jgi:hypothetical protein